MALCFWFGFKLYLEHHIHSITTIVVVLMSVMMFTFSLTQTAAPIIAATRAASAAADFFAVIDAPKPIMTGLKDPQASAMEDVFFSSVNFAYPSRPHVKVLDDSSVGMISTLRRDTNFQRVPSRIRKLVWTKKMTRRMSLMKRPKRQLNLVARS
jgi:ABC-type multidrug transport system fused ATPase/permease subunit